MEVTLNEVEVTKLNLQPGETLVVSIKSDWVGQTELNSIKEGFNKRFPNNSVLVLGFGMDDSVKFTSIAALETKTQSSVGCGTQSYCSDCSCGKKEMANGN